MFFINSMLQLRERPLNLPTMKLARLLALAAVAALCTSQVAVAQYEWLDHNGRHVYSDQMPPADIPEADILQEPGARTPAQTPRRAPQADQPDAQAAKAPGTAEAPAGPPDDAELEQRKQELDAAEQARAAAQEKEHQAMRADNCQRAQQSRQTLESGMRVARINEAGERIIMDDTQRAAELQRADEVIASNC